MRTLTQSFRTALAIDSHFQGTTSSASRSNTNGWESMFAPDYHCTGETSAAYGIAFRHGSHAAALVRFCMALFFVMALSGAARAQWTQVSGTPTVSTCLLLTDGDVLCQLGEDGNSWDRLKPDSSGNYANGTWTAVGNLPTGFGPTYYASAVLPDGRVLIAGGEYNAGTPNCPSGTGCDAALAAIFDPTTNLWKSVPTPTGWTQVGDAVGVVLSDGRFILGQFNGTAMAQFNPGSNDFTVLSTSGKTDNNSEEGWTLLPDGTVLTVDTGTEGGTNSEIFDPSTNAWASAGSTIVSLPDNSAIGTIYVPEIGPAVLRPDGTVLATGATQHNAIYDTKTKTWSAANDFPVNGVQMVAADAPASLLPNGHVLVATSQFFSGPTHFYEFDGTNFNLVTDPSNNGDASYQARMLILPTGQVLYTTNSSNAELYTPSGGPDPSWKPVITSCPKVVLPNTSGYSISGTQFNGLSQGTAYGDNTQTATNYPLVRIRNHSSGHISYARTYNHSSMGVATGSTIVNTTFDTLASLETGPADLFVVANGIASDACVVNDNPPVTTASLSGTLGTNGWWRSAVTVTLSATDLDGQADIVGTFYTLDGGSTQTYTNPFVISGDAYHQLTFWSRDKEGNEDTPHKAMTVMIDTTDPTLVFAPQVPPANSYGWNNTPVDIPYVPADNLSGVASAIPPSPLHFASEGAGQTAAVTVFDVAGNSAIFVTPAVNIDLTPPEAFLQFDPVSHDIQLFGRDSLSGVPPCAPSVPCLIAPSSVVQVKHHSDDHEGDKEEDGKAELRTYLVADRAGNTLALGVEVSKGEHHISARILSLRYNQQPLIHLMGNSARFQWESEHGSLHELEQELQTAKGEESPRVEAQFEHQANRTIIRQEEPEPKSRITKPGLDLLRLATSNGTVVIEF